VIASFALAALKCCGEQRFAGMEILRRLQQMKEAGSPPETLSLEAGELIMGIRGTLLKWPEQDDGLLKQEVAQILVELAGDNAKAAQLWEAVRERKQRIVANVGDFDEQMMSLARRTHFTVQEIERLREEVRKLNPDAKKVKGVTDGSVAETRLDPATFKQVVSRAVPEFPRDLCGRLFKKLDAFGVGKLTFVELACGMSALSLGTMDEKLQVCFDLFDSEGRGALTLKDLGDLCTTLFRVALAQGFAGAKVASTDEVLGNMERFNWSTEQAGSGDVVTELSKAWRSPSGMGRSARMSLPPGHMLHRATTMRSPPTASSASSSMYVGSPTESAGLEGGREQPWRSMLMRLLVAAHVHSPGGPPLVAFEDFRRAAHMEPALLCLFSWCLPRPPDGSAPAWMAAPDQEPSVLRRLCSRVCGWLSFLSGGRRG
jgi:Ca2+-binding EF-hand superfamily protein